MLSYVKYTTIKLSKGKEMAVAPLLRYTEIPLKVSLMVVCGINISEDFFMYIIVGLWDTQSVLILVYNYKHFERSGENVFAYREFALLSFKSTQWFGCFFLIQIWIGLTTGVGGGLLCGTIYSKCLPDVHLHHFRILFKIISHFRITEKSLSMR